MASWFLWLVSGEYIVASLIYAYNRNWPLAGMLVAYAFANVCLIYGAK